MRKFRMYMEDVSNDGGEFQLVFEIDGKVKDIQTEYCVENCMIESCNFFSRNCEKYEYDTRFDRMEVNLSFQLGI